MRSNKHEDGFAKYTRGKSYGGTVRCEKPELKTLVDNLVAAPRFAIADDLSAARAVLQIVYLSKTLAAVFVLRLNLHPAKCAMVDDKCIHGLILPDTPNVCVRWEKCKDPNR